MEIGKVIQVGRQGPSELIIRQKHNLELTQIKDRVGKCTIQMIVHDNKLLEIAQRSNRIRNGARKLVV